MKLPCQCGDQTPTDSIPQTTAVPKHQSADLYDVSVSLTADSVVVRLIYGEFDELVLRLGWRAAAAFLDFADRRLSDADVDATRHRIRRRWFDSVSWPAALEQWELQWFFVQPVIFQYAPDTGRFTVRFHRPWDGEHEEPVILTANETTIRALAWECRNGLAINHRLSRP